MQSTVYYIWTDEKFIPAYHPWRREKTRTEQPASVRLVNQKQKHMNKPLSWRPEFFCLFVCLFFQLHFILNHRQNVIQVIGPLWLHVCFLFSVQYSNPSYPFRILQKRWERKNITALTVKTVKTAQFMSPSHLLHTFHKLSILFFNTLVEKSK